MLLKLIKKITFGDRFILTWLIASCSLSAAAAKVVELMRSYQTCCRKVSFMLHTLVRAAERRVYNCNALEFTKNCSL